ncbi:MAG: Bax inhibitor-1/YccA family protein [Heliobacteriaceae bacterium]|jgi:uncharacterized YccA/Bax inhibitor family protein|nr:Bax inhibitor-1/YccA family protein [Heliobacteriaceae bacterium]
MSNPILNENFASQERILSSEPMTINGAITKTALLLALVAVSFIYTWSLAFQGFTDKVQMLIWIGAIGGLISVLAAAFTTRASMAKGENPTAVIWLAPAYAIFEGLCLGGISAAYEAFMEGIVLHAIVATFAVMLVMLALFRTGAIKVTEKFRSVLLTAMLSILAIYLIQFVAQFFGRGIPVIFGSGMFGIGFSIVVIAIAALNLIIDFDFIEQASQNLMPKNYEWYGALGLMVTLVWLYLEILRLLAKLNSRR